MSAIVTIILLWLGVSLLIFLVTRKKTISLGFTRILVFLGGRIAGGAAFGYVYKSFYGGDDTWAINGDSYLQYKRLLQHPIYFFTDFFDQTQAYSVPDLYCTPTGHLIRLEFSLITKIIAPFNLFSHGNYYVNMTLYSCFGFFGTYLLYKCILKYIHPENKGWVAAILFLFPPGAFWLSGIRSEGLLMLCTGVLLYYFEQYLKKRSVKYVFICIIAFALAFILRSGFAVLLLAPLIVRIINLTTGKRIWPAAGYLYTLVLIAVIAGSFILPDEWNALSIVAKQQHAFLDLKGNTRLTLDTLNGKPGSYLRVLPQAVSNTFIRPFPWEAKGMLQWFLILENMFCWMLFLVIAVKFRNGLLAALKEPFIVVILLTGITNYLLIGYLVPFPGAIVRYKIIPELLLLSVAMMAAGLHPRRQSTTAVSQI